MKRPKLHAQLEAMYKENDILGNISMVRLQNILQANPGYILSLDVLYIAEHRLLWNSNPLFFDKQLL